MEIKEKEKKVEKTAKKKDTKPFPSGIPPEDKKERPAITMTTLEWKLILI